MKMCSLVLLASLQQTCATCCNQANLGSWDRAAGCGGWVTNMLMVASSVRVLDWIHCRTTDLWEAVPLDLVLVVVGPSLQHWLLNTSTTSTDTDNSTAT